MVESSARDGRVVEMLSENTVEGMLEGYLLTGRLHGFISSYEAFIHVIDSMFNQHAKWLTICNHLPWRGKIPSLNILVTSTVWRQDHNGSTLPIRTRVFWMWRSTRARCCRANLLAS